MEMEAVQMLEGNSEQRTEKRIERKKTIQKRGYKIMKRIFDVVMSTIALVVLSPVFLVTAIAIYIEDKGSVFYTQLRVGEKEEIFEIYKFRSMRLDADKIHEQMKVEYGSEDVSFKLKEDPRVTKVGIVIRKYNIDELPQLINILKGEMSIVGPRPLPVYEYEEERLRYGSRYAERYQVPQGLTCKWQISNRSKVEFEDRMQMDVDYSKTCGFFMDISLIIRTLLSCVTGKAAY